MMEPVGLVLVGFGNVGQAFAQLLLEKQAELAEKYGMRCHVNGIMTGRHGAAINPDGIDLEEALRIVREGGQLKQLDASDFSGDTLDFIQQSPGDVIDRKSVV